MKLKKWALLVMVAVLAAAFAAPAYAEDGSLQYILDNGQLIMGLDVGFAPMGFNDEDGEIIGYDVDLAQEVCARLGVELVLQPIDWAAKEMELATKNIDCIWNGMSITPDRVESMALTEAYLYNALVFVVKDEALQVKEDLAGKVVAVQNGSTAAYALDGAFDEGAEVPFKPYADTLGEIRGYADYMLALMDLSNGNVDAVLVDVVVADFILSESDMGAEMFYMEDKLMDDYFAVGFRKEDIVLRDKVSQILGEMAEDGKLAEITTDWFGSNVSLIGAGE